MEDRRLHFCIDHGQLKLVLVRDSYLIPCIDEFDSLGKVQMYSASDADSWYWQSKMNDKDGDKTAFELPRAIKGVLDAVLGQKRPCNVPGSEGRQTQTGKIATRHRIH